MTEAEIFSAYETEMILSVLEDVTDTFSISSGEIINIDNSSNSKVYPIVSITSSSDTISSLDINGISINLSQSIDSNNPLLLDFKNQEYSYNGADIIDSITFNDNDRPYLEEDSMNTIIIGNNNTIDVEVQYKNYNEFHEPKFVQDFRVSEDKSYTPDRKFKKDSPNKQIKNEKNINISFSNYAYDWQVHQSLKNEETFRVTYNENHTNGDKDYQKDIIGIKFNTYERYYRDSTGFIFESLTGEGTKLL